MKKLITTIIIVVIAVVFIGTTSVYVLDETEQAIVTQFGDPVGGPRTNPGLHFKLPFIQKVTIFENRILAWDGNPQEIPTGDNKFIHVDSYARWKIDNPLNFFTSVRTESQAQARLDDIVEGTIRDYVAVNDLAKLIRSADREMAVVQTKSNTDIDIDVDVDSTPDSAGTAAQDSVRQKMTVPISGKRNKIRENIVSDIQKTLKKNELGITVIDFRFKRIDYNPEVQKKVFDRMIAKQQKIAEKYRAIGEGAREQLMGKIEREKKQILSEAYRTAEEIRGEADGEATSIYASAFAQSNRSREFYEFIRSLELYENSMDSSSTMVLSSDSELLQYINSTESK